MVFLPLEIFLKVLEHSDQDTKYKLGLTCKLLSSYAIQRLWNRPVITKTESLKSLIKTLQSMSSFYPYKNWMKALSIHMKNTESLYELIPDHLFTSLSLLSLKMISLSQIDVIECSSNSSSQPSSPFKNFLLSQLSKGIEELRLSRCGATIIYSLIAASRMNKTNDLHKLDIRECSMEDIQLKFLSKFHPKLRTLKLDRCGCFSDQGLVAIAKNCPELRTLVATLPSYFFQSNTITIETIKALTTYCPKLQLFVCDGQIRILELINENQKHTFRIITCI